MTAPSPDHNIVFLPGFMCDARLFTPQISALTKAGFNCHVGDLTKGNTYGQIAKNILQTAPESFALAGLSMGGTMALEIIRQAPERVTHLALLNTTANADRNRPAREAHMRRVEAGELETIMGNDYLPRYLAPTNTDDTLLPLLFEMARDLGPDVFIQKSRAMMTRASLQPVLATINCPTLILTGQDDTLCPPVLHHEMAEHIKGATLSIVPDCGHISTLEQPEAVTAALLGVLGLG
jgi:pimeloyl-ACP methyl ester carboxylesterase